MSSTAVVDRKQEILDRITDFTPWFRDVQNQRPSGSNGWVSGRCPLHDDAHNSFSFDPASGGWTCFASCGSGDIFSYLMAVHRQDFPTVLRNLSEELGLTPTRTNRSNADSLELAERAAVALQNCAIRRNWLHEHRGLTDATIVDFGIGWNPRDGRYTIPVRDETGRIVNVRRYSPDKSPKILNLKGCGSPARLLGIDDLVRHPDEDVVICEGELDCLLLRQHGLLAVTGTAGVGHFPREWAGYFEHRNVAIICDCDDHGLKGANAVARKLADNGVTKVKVVRLPLAGTPDDKDITDFFVKRGGTVEALRDHIAAAPTYTPGRTVPDIQINDRQPRDISVDACSAIHVSNDPPWLFNQAGAVFRISVAGSYPYAELVSEPYMRTVLNSVANWVKISKNGTVTNTKPPQELASELLARPDDGLPYLDGVVATPVYTASGHLTASAGYDRESRLWVHLGSELRDLRLDPAPSLEAIAAARNLIVDDLLVDFPFAEPSDRAHAVAAIVLPHIRRMIRGCTPLHLLEATTPGSGKTLLADLVSMIATGQSSRATTITKNEDDSRKKITSLLMRGAPIVLIDNVKNELESAQLACALTAEIWSDRLLGGNRIIELPNLTVWLVTANNPRLSEEMVRRTVRIRIEPPEERPWERREFKHQHIRQWTRDHRAQLVGAVLTLVQAWLISGRPKGQVTIGSFEEWAEIMGGILGVAGIAGFLEGHDRFYENADTDGQQWRAFVEVWRQEHGHHAVTVSQLLELAEQRDLISFAIVGHSPQAQRVKLGKALGQIRDRRFGDVQVRVGQDRHTKTRIYQLCPVQDRLFRRGAES